MRRLRNFALLLLLTMPLMPQVTPREYYILRSVTGRLNRVTVRQPATAALSKPLKFKGAYVTSSVECKATISKNGTVSGGTLGVIQILDERSVAAVSKATFDGTVTGAIPVMSESLPAGAKQRYEESGLYLIAAGGRQLTVELASAAAGTLSIQFLFSEQ